MLLTIVQLSCVIVCPTVSLCLMRLLLNQPFPFSVISDNYRTLTMAEAAATNPDISSTASAMGRLDLATAPEVMDTSEASQRNDSVSSGRGSMGAPSRGQRRWLKRQEKLEAKKVKTAEDEGVSGVSGGKRWWQGTEKCRWRCRPGRR